MPRVSDQSFNLTHAVAFLHAHNYADHMLAVIEKLF